MAKPRAVKLGRGYRLVKSGFAETVVVVEAGVLRQWLHEPGYPLAESSIARAGGIPGVLLWLPDPPKPAKKAKVRR